MEETIIVRIGSAEKAAIKKKAADAGMDLSKYIRFLLAGCPASRHPDMIREIQELRREVARVGNNINQIARAQNAYLFSSSDKESLRRDMKQLNDSMAAVISVINGNGSNKG